MPFFVITSPLVASFEPIKVIAGEIAGFLVDYGILSGW